MIDFSSAISKFDKASTVAIICHINPDGDTLGAGLALYYYLTNLGKKAQVYCDAINTDRLDFIVGEHIVKNSGNISCDLVVAVDCADVDRTGVFYKDFLRANDNFVIDHHLSNTRYGKCNLIDASASSTCQMMYGLFEQMNISAIDKRVASLLYAGILTDSGAFLYPTTTSETHTVVAKLHEYNIDANSIYIRLFMDKPYRKFLLENRVLSSTKLYEDNRIGIVTIRQADFEATGSSMDDTEGIVNRVQNIDCVKIAILVTETAKDKYKISFRSTKELDVNACAAYFGGGGHKNASGCQLHGDYYEVIDKLLFVAKNALC